jgi:hypothetical protein
MLTLKQGQKKRPPGGHHATFHGVTFRGETHREVADKLRDFRVTNALHVGDPEQEVLFFYLKHWPYLLREGEAMAEVAQNKEYDDWRDWAIRTWQHPPAKMLTTKEARERWEVCLKCPCNVRPNWPETNESSEITRRIFLLRRGLPVPKDLGFCLLHRWDNSVSPFLDKPKDFSGRKDQEDVKGCWV